MCYLQILKERKSTSLSILHQYHVIPYKISNGTYEADNLISKQQHFYSTNKHTNHSFSAKHFLLFLNITHQPTNALKYMSPPAFALRIKIDYSAYLTDRDWSDARLPPFPNINAYKVFLGMPPQQHAAQARFDRDVKKFYALAFLFRVARHRQARQRRLTMEDVSSEKRSGSDGPVRGKDGKLLLDTEGELEEIEDEEVSEEGYEADTEISEAERDVEYELTDEEMEKCLRMMVEMDTRIQRTRELLYPRET